MHNNEQLITKFYTAFQALDGDKMIECYHPDVSFRDPVFPDLHGDEAKAMWKMLCSRAKNFELTFDQVEADDTHGKAHWEAKYLFSATGKNVHNIIDANFTFKEGLIIEHQDHFNLWKWSQQALGPVGLLLGWSPLIKNKVRLQAAENLQNYLRKNH